MIDEHKLGLSAPTNRWSYFYLVTFLSYVRRLSDEHKSVINIYSSVFYRQIFGLFRVVDQSLFEH
jgi:hypothetical protein